VVVVVRVGAGVVKVVLVGSALNILSILQTLQQDLEEVIKTLLHSWSIWTME
jgi:hypothetical protein